MAYDKDEDGSINFGDRTDDSSTSMGKEDNRRFTR